MEAQALKTRAFDLIGQLPPNKIEYVIKFTQFLSQQDFVENVVPAVSSSKRLPLGFLKGKAKVHFSDDWEMTDEELLGL